MEEYTADGVLVKGRGVCASYARAMQKLLRTAGIPCLYVSGTGRGVVKHAWNIVKIGGQYYHLDTTWDDSVNSNKKSLLRHEYFNVTDTKMQRDHQWDRRAYPPCNSTSYPRRYGG